MGWQRSKRWRWLLLAGTVAGLRIARALRRVDLRGKVVMVTGGGRGLGLAIARAFAQRGCRLAVCGRDGGNVAEAVVELGRMGVDALGVACDTSRPAQVQRFVSTTLARFGAIDVLVNNAGQCFVGPAAELAVETVEAALRHVFWAQVHPTMAVLPQMRKRGFGRIVNITSIGGKLPLPHQAAYTAGKFAATGWSETLAAELAHEGIVVSTITPPPLKNGAPLHAHFGGRVEDEFRWFAKLLTSPLTADDAERTAEVVVDACEHGDHERSVSLVSWLLSRAHGLAPNLVLRLLARIDQALPPAAPPGETSTTMLGMDVAAASEDAGIQQLLRSASDDELPFLPERDPSADQS